MAIDPKHVAFWLFSQIGLGVIYLIKEFWKIFRDQGAKNSADIGAMMLQMEKSKADLNALFEKVRALESAARVTGPRTPGS